MIFGSNVWSKAVEFETKPEKVVHNCIGCDNRNINKETCKQVNFEGVRYKCAHCEDYDFCDICEALWYDKATEEMVEEARKRAGHE
mmetsp:Transcript_14713/g.7194  ORF Transcript_14713/g.7194 Transcript_14713/m.7194 type:complete len:86 (+) Transcript_14713:1285-1542(+)